MIIETTRAVQMKEMERDRLQVSSVLYKVKKSMMTDPLYDENLVEESVGCVIKRSRCMVNNDLRAEIRKYRESADRSEKTIFFFFHQKNPFG